jgi:hypothetical protein
MPASCIVSSSEIKGQNTQFSNLIAAVHRQCLFVLRIASMDQTNLEVLKYLQAPIIHACRFRFCSS